MHHHLAYAANRNLDPAITAQYSLGVQPIAQGPPPPGHAQAHQQGGSPGPDVIMGDDGQPLDNSPEGRRKRELTGTKRAAQNRAAQRAFRQRKDTYIKKLEDDVRSASALPALQEEYHRVQSENYHLRDYIMALQLRLLDALGDYPPPPAHIELRDPRQFGAVMTATQQRAAPAASMGGGNESRSDDADDRLRAAVAQSASEEPHSGVGQSPAVVYGGPLGREMAEPDSGRGQEEASAALHALRDRGPEQRDTDAT